MNSFDDYIILSVTEKIEINQIAKLENLFHTKINVDINVINPSKNTSTA